MTAMNRESGIGKREAGARIGIGNRELRISEHHSHSPFPIPDSPICERANFAKLSPVICEMQTRGDAMLREIEGIAAEPATRRRWFHDDYFDLFVWQTDDGAITLFQLCYGIEAEERALVWHREAGLFHDGADPGISLITQVVERFETAGKSLPRNVRNTV